MLGACAQMMAARNALHEAARADATREERRSNARVDGGERIVEQRDVGARICGAC